MLSVKRVAVLTLACTFALCSLPVHAQDPEPDLPRVLVATATMERMRPLHASSKRVSREWSAHMRLAGGGVRGGRR